MTDTIKVHSGREDDRVVLSERHPDHPGGEVFIAGQYRNKLNKDGSPAMSGGEAVRELNVVEVAKTPRVLAALHSGALVEAKSAPAAKAG